MSIPTTSLKFPPIVGLAYSSARSKDWDDILTAHKQEVVARTWSVRDKKLGKWTMNLDEASSEKGKKKRPDVVGSVQASIQAFLFIAQTRVLSSENSGSAGCLRLSVREFRIGVVFVRRDSHVEYAVGHET